MVNTILSDDERREILWSCTTSNGHGESTDEAKLMLAIEAAVLAKLREQEPVAWCSLTPSGKIGYFDGEPMVMVGPVGNEHHTTPLFPYAAPLPAVAQVPWSKYNLDDMCEAFSRCIEAQAQKSPFHQPINSDAMMALRILRGFLPAMKMLAAAPKAPVQESFDDFTVKRVRISRKSNDSN